MFKERSSACYCVAKRDTSVIGNSIEWCYLAHFLAQAQIIKKIHPKKISYTLILRNF